MFLFTVCFQIFPGYYHFEHKRLAKRSLEPSDEHHRNLLSEPNVSTALLYVILMRVETLPLFRRNIWLVVRKYFNLTNTLYAS